MSGVVECVDHSGRLPDDILWQILSIVRDAKSLARCMSVCTSWRNAVKQVEYASLICPGPFFSFDERLQAVASRVQNLDSLKYLTVKLGTLTINRDKPSCDRCMRYAEIGPFVDKFVFLAAKSGDAECFDSCLDESAVTCSSTSEMNLKQVMGSSDMSLKRMSPVIVFAIISGFDDFLDGLPELLHKLPKLRKLLLVDVKDGITINVRPHHVDQVRSRHTPLPKCQLGDAFAAMEERTAGSSSPSRTSRLSWLHGTQEDSPGFDISFWRSDKVTVGMRELAGVSLCIATNSSLPLLDADLEELRTAAVAGPILASLIPTVNKQSPNQQHL